MFKSLALATLLLVLMVFLGFQYYITAVPILVAPVSVEESRFVEQDTSLLVTLIDSENRRFTIGLRGDIQEKPEETALFMIANPDLIPYVYWPGYRSNDEKRVLELLEDMLESQPQEGPASEIYGVLRERN
jgi:hypothetical protein